MYSEDIQNTYVKTSEIPPDDKIAAPFKCIDCGDRLKRKGGLLSHVRNFHSGRQSFSCGECGKTFIVKSNLKRHTRLTCIQGRDHLFVVDVERVRSKVTFGGTPP